MICWRCQTSNSDFAVYCSKCGSPLTRRPGARPWKNPWLIIAAASLGLLAIAVVLFIVFFKRPPAGAGRAVEIPPETAVAHKGSPFFLPGRIIVSDSGAVDVAKFAAPVVGAGWVATPLWALFGGAEIRFREGEEAETPLDQGFWNAGDPVILWRLPNFEPEQALDFGAWTRDRPVLWRPASEEPMSLQVAISDPQPRGFYLSFALPAEVKEAGVLLQGTRVVGWTFGEGTPRGYLWAGPGMDELASNVGFGEVFGTVVGAGREVAFFRALALGEDADAAERLSAFAHGFQLPPLLTEGDLPLRLRASSILSRMQALASNLIQNGRSRDVVRILSEEVLTEADDLELLKAAVLAQAHEQDYNRAIQYLGRLKKTVFEAQGRSSSELEPFRAQLYKDWLREILDKGGYFSAHVAYDEAERAFPDDPEIRLLGVEVALAENNLARAKELLQGKEIPPFLKERADYLASRLKTAQEEEALVVPFNPAEKRIYLEAKLNGTYLQKFVVDTGATASSIPSQAVDALGIKLDQQTPVRWLTTASGLIATYEVFLNSVDIMGYRVQNIKVIVLDLPLDETLGVLGMDFLNNFRYEIDNQAGVFRLRKK